MSIRDRVGQGDRSVGGGAWRARQDTREAVEVQASGEAAGQLIAQGPVAAGSLREHQHLDSPRDDIDLVGHRGYAEVRHSVDDIVVDDDGRHVGRGADSAVAGHGMVDDDRVADRVFIMVRGDGDGLVGEPVRAGKAQGAGDGQPAAVRHARGHGHSAVGSSVQPHVVGGHAAFGHAEYGREDHHAIGNRPQLEAGEELLIVDGALGHPAELGRAERDGCHGFRGGSERVAGTCARGDTSRARGSTVDRPGHLDVQRGCLRKAHHELARSQPLQPKVQRERGAAIVVHPECPQRAYPFKEACGQRGNLVPVQIQPLQGIPFVEKSRREPGELVGG